MAAHSSAIVCPLLAAACCSSRLPQLPRACHRGKGRAVVDDLRTVCGVSCRRAPPPLLIHRRPPAPFLPLRPAQFTGDLFSANCGRLASDQSEGMTLGQLEVLLDSRALDAAMHKTVNWHSGLYNTHVLRAAIILLNTHRTSFQQL